MVANLQQITADPKMNLDLRTEDNLLAVLPFFHMYAPAAAPAAAAFDAAF